jgi:outer membrane lipoprotein-sorting protein
MAERKPMHRAGRFLSLALISGAFLFPRPASADDLKRVLDELNVAAKNFHTTSADFKFDSKTTVPIPDEEIQSGTVFYERKASGFQMGIHITRVDNQDVPKTIVCCAGGKIQMYEKLTGNVSTLDQFSQYESWFMLGFGASGTELEEKWNISYGGSEVIDGVKTEKLILVAKDEKVRAKVPMVTVWMDTRRGVSLRQLYDQGNGQTRDCYYTNIQVNPAGGLPGYAFELKGAK